MKALDELIAKQSKPGLELGSGPQMQVNIQDRASPSVEKATQDLKEKVAQQQLKKQQAKAADQITFEILADTVAKEIAVMLRSTVDRNRSKSKKI